MHGYFCFNNEFNYVFHGANLILGLFHLFFSPRNVNMQHYNFYFKKVITLKVNEALYALDINFISP